MNVLSPGLGKEDLETRLLERDDIRVEDEGGVRFLAWEGEAVVREKRDRVEKCRNER